MAECFGKPSVTVSGDLDRPVRFIVQSAFQALDERDEHPLLEAGDGS